MLTVQELWAKGRHGTLIKPTSFSAEAGQVVMVQADDQMQRTALALALTGRYLPTGGTIELTADRSSRNPERNLRRRSVLVDSPGINEPENHMKVHDYTSEMLSYALPLFGRPRSSQWLDARGLGELDGLWTEQLTGDQRTRLVTALAADNRTADVVVFDTPSRFHTHTAAWLPYLQELAEDPEHPRIVIAVINHVSSSWQGLAVYAGNALEPEQEEAEEILDTQEAAEPQAVEPQETAILEEAQETEVVPDASHETPTETLESKEPAEIAGTQEMAEAAKSVTEPTQTTGVVESASQKVANLEKKEQA